MMPTDWNATKDDLRSSVPLSQYQHWFNSLELIRTEGDTLVLGVPTRFHEEWIREHYNTHLSEAIRNRMGMDYRFEFEVVHKENYLPDSADKPKITTEIRPQLKIVPETAKEIVSNLPSTTIPYFEMPFNELAVKSALMLLDGTCPQFSSMLVQAAVGMGKTHFLSFIGKYISEKYPSYRVRYTNADSFGEELVDSLRSDSFDRLSSFKQKYRYHTDILLFDDVHILAKRFKTQNEVMCVFNELISSGKKIIFTSLIHPNELTDFLEPLRSRLLSSIIVEVDFPPYNERIQLLKKICTHYTLNIDETVIQTLASGGHNDLRQLIGFTLRMHMQSTLEKKELNHNYLSEHGIGKTLSEKIGYEEILSTIERMFSVSREEILSKSRRGPVNFARQIGMYLARTFTNHSLEEIGKLFKRDHATVRHAHQKISEILCGCSSKRYEIEYIIEKLKSRYKID